MIEDEKMIDQCLNKKMFLYIYDNDDIEIRYYQEDNASNLKNASSNDTKEFKYYVETGVNNGEDFLFEVIKTNKKSFFALEDSKTLFNIIKNHIINLKEEDLKTFTLKSQFETFIRMFEKTKNRSNFEKIVGAAGEILMIKKSYEYGFDISNYFHQNNFSKFDLYIQSENKSKYIEIKTTTSSYNIDIAKIKDDQLSMKKDSTILVYVKIILDENGSNIIEIIKDCLKDKYISSDYINYLNELYQELLEDNNAKKLKFDLESLKINLYKVKDLDVLDYNKNDSISNIRYDLALPADKKRDISELKIVLEEL